MYDKALRQQGMTAVAAAWQEHPALTHGLREAAPGAYPSSPSLPGSTSAGRQTAQDAPLLAVIHHVYTLRTTYCSSRPTMKAPPRAWPTALGTPGPAHAPSGTALTWLSMSTLKNLTEGNSWASWSYTGAIILQGPHLGGRAAGRDGRACVLLTSVRRACQPQPARQPWCMRAQVCSHLAAIEHARGEAAATEHAGGEWACTNGCGKVVKAQAHQTAVKSMMAPPLLDANSLSAAWYSSLDCSSTTLPLAAANRGRRAEKGQSRCPQRQRAGTWQQAVRSKPCDTCPAVRLILVASCAISESDERHPTSSEKC